MPINIYDKIKIYNENNIGLLNMTDEFFALYLKKILLSQNKSILVVTPTLYEANKIYSNFSNDESSFLFQSEQIINEDIISKSPETKAERLNVINKIQNNKSIVFTDVSGYLTKLTSKKEYNNSIIDIEIGQEINIENLKERIFNNGYNKEVITTTTGEYSVRGFVIDIFPINEEYPIRIEFFGNEVESIRYFDPDTQKSIKKINKLKIYIYN